MERDPRKEPQYAERIPYLVVYGEPGSRLVDLVIDPHAFVQAHGSLKLNALYYITKQINAALDRVLALLGVSVTSWFNSMPPSMRTPPHKRQIKSRAPSKKQRTIDSYYLSRHCSVRSSISLSYLTLFSGVRCLDLCLAAHLP